VGQFHWDPGSYLALMREEVPSYERLQEEVVRATGTGVRRILELGVGTGETTRRLLSRHPAATLVGIDASAAMLAAARAALGADDAHLSVRRLEEPLPEGRFDLVVSVLTVHHLDGPGKADLFRRLPAVLDPGGRVVIGDVVVPDDPGDAVTPIDGDHDTPSAIDDQLAWLASAGLDPAVAWAERDLAVLTADARG
jgi:tRNA (cmo5U34)-methyltransferase